MTVFLICIPAKTPSPVIYDYDYDYEMVLLRHTISTMYHRIIFKSCKKTQYITMKCVIGEQTRKVCCPLT